MKRLHRLTAAGRAMLRDSFAHFILLGAALFAATSYWEERARLTRITITANQVRNLSAIYRLQHGEPPSSQQLEALVDRLIDQEMMYREALRLGLDENDEIVRRRLAQKYEFLQQDLEIPPNVTEAQLLEFYRQHLDRYRQPRKVTFTHVYFSPDLRSEAAARAAANALASDLNRQGLARAADRGDRFPGVYDFVAVSEEGLARAFGREGLAEAVFDIEPQVWAGPFRSGLGWHIVYVHSQQPARPLAFKDVRGEVQEDYLEAEHVRRSAQAIEKLRRNFLIVRE